MRFLVDGQWRVADDLPAAVDDQGSLANYVAVPLTYGLPGQTQPPVITTATMSTNTIQITMPPPQFASVPPPKKVQPGQSFWSADSSADGEGDGDDRRPSTSSGAAGNKAQGDVAKTAAAAAAAAYIQAPWTDVFPPELLEAAREEEAYLAASAGQYDSPSGTARVSGFVPAPNIPPAPGLPRHLDKLILNSRVGEQKRGEGSVNGSTHGHGHRGDRGDHGHRDPGSGVGSGQGSSARRERRERERERERERGTRSSRRGNVPPPPPPSEDGGDYEPPAISVPKSTPASSAAELPAASSSSAHPGRGSGSGTTTPSNAAQAAATAHVLASTSAGTLSGASAGSGGMESTGTTTAATTPQASLPATPTGQLSPMQTPPKGAGWAAGGVGALPPSALLAGIPQQQYAQASGVLPTPSSHNAPPPPPQTLERAAMSGSRAITIDDANMPALTDDNSVLPVPSHVVLHHLCTSAIKNGVLAVANTTRYRKKVGVSFGCVFFLFVCLWFLERGSAGWVRWLDGCGLFVGWVAGLWI